MQADSAQAPPQTGKRILCIEDEHFISELYIRALQKAGHNVTSVVDGEKGLAEALTGNYDVILLDIMLPNMTGIEILKELRKKKPDLRSKVIIATNLEQSDENRAEIEKQADAYVIKAEVTPRQLVEFLNQIKV
jgi:DNA-binding response OmpR family regulator